MLVVGDAVTPTGFARVIHSLLERINHRYEVHHLGVNYAGDPHDASWRIYPAGKHGDGRGFNRLLPLVERVRPDLIFMVGDLWVLMQYAGLLARLPSRPPTLAYFPVESDPVEPDAVTHLLRGADALATCTQFGLSQLNQAIEAARSARPDLPVRDVVLLPHGVDRLSFHPIADEPLERTRRARRLLFPERGELQDAFVVLNANRNQPRKRIDLTIEGFSLFAKGLPENVYLYLHMAREDAGWDIQRLARRFGVSERLLVTHDDNRCRDESSEHLNLIYNACDVGVNTSSAEGFGLVSFEHAATGAAQIIPRHTSLSELWDGAARFVEPRYRSITERILTTSYHLSAADVAEALHDLYSRPEYRDELGAAAFDRASESRFDWNSIAAKLERLFTRLTAIESSSAHTQAHGA